MKKPWKTLLALLLAVLTLCGCSQMPDILPGAPAETTEAPAQTVPATVPMDGSPEDVTCKGSYEEAVDLSAVAATMEGAELTNGMLNAWYWMAVADYREADRDIAPDFDRPLDTQPCPLDSSVNSWQQYFLRQALNNWHSAQALTLQADAEGLPAEDVYQPNLDNHEIYLSDVPAMQYHTSYNLETYHPNTLHQQYLDNIPEMLEALAQEKGYADGEALAQDSFGTTLADLQAAVDLYNRGYMYFTTLGYYNRPTQEELDDYYAQGRLAYTQEGKTVNLRHILLVPDNLVKVDDRPAWEKQNEEPTEPVVLEYVEVAEDGTVTCSEEAWAKGLADAEALLKQWAKEPKRREGNFAQLARYHSEDPGSAVNGGAYYNIRKGQLREELDRWCFDEARQPGDTTIIRSKYGYHILYFSAAVTAGQAQAEEDLRIQRQSVLVTAAREAYPMDVDYGAIALAGAEGTVSGSDVLYPDIAHERYPEAPVFLQQDYGGTLFGGDLLRTNGCGITTFSMLSSYMTDEEYTPPEMCARYGNYSYQGTDGRIFQLESQVLGYYCKEKTYDPKIAKKALEEGYPVVSLQHKGYWTRGGHYLLVEKMNEDGTVQVRDSNIYNYGKLDGHKVDYFKWSLIPANGSAFWIFEKKVTAIPACSRCGTEGTAHNLMEDPEYICEKCSTALLRRETYQTACGQ